MENQGRGRPVPDYHEMKLPLLGGQWLLYFKEAKLGTIRRESCVVIPTRSVSCSYLQEVVFLGWPVPCLGLNTFTGRTLGFGNLVSPNVCIFH